MSDFDILRTPRRRYISMEELRALLRDVKEYVPPTVEGCPIEGVIGVGAKGSIVGALYAMEFGLRFTAVERLPVYRAGSQGLQLASKQIIGPSHLGTGRGNIIIEEMILTGETVEALREAFPQAWIVALFANDEATGFHAVNSRFVNDVLQVAECQIVFPWGERPNKMSPTAHRAEEAQLAHVITHPNNTVVVDIDGVLRPEGLPKDKMVEPEGSLLAIEGAKVFLKTLCDDRYYVCLHTARPQDEARSTVAWLSKYGFDGLYHQIQFGKPCALAYVDDRAVHHHNDPRSADTWNVTLEECSRLQERAAVEYPQQEAEQ